MTTANTGNELNRVCAYSKSLLFAQGELAQLSVIAFNLTATRVRDNPEQEIKLDVPVGYTQSRHPLLSSRNYKKDELLQRYTFLSTHQMAINGIYQMVIVIEAMLEDLVRIVLLKYPEKIGAKKMIGIREVLAADSIETLHLHATNSLLNELSYKSPAAFADSLEQLLSLNLEKCPAFHKYVEMRATRDIHVHNRGVANEVYIAKAGSHARVDAGALLPVETFYFLESYEVCLKLVEWVEKKLHDKWPSTEFEESQAAKIPDSDEAPGEQDAAADSKTRR